MNKDTLPWLLERENPSVRCWALVDVLNRPASDREVQQARAAIIAQPLVKRLFALQHADGQALHSRGGHGRPESVVCAEALLSADYDVAGEHKRWLTFGVPRLWDLLAALRALAAHGYGRDRRF